MTLRFGLFVLMALASAPGCRSPNGDGARPPASVQAPAASHRVESTTSSRRNAPSAVTPAAPPALAGERPPPGAADTDPNNDEIVAPPDPISGCEQALEHAEIAYRPATLPL